MSAALLALGEALVDPVAVGLVGNNENPAVGPRCRPRQKRHAGQKRLYRSHAAPLKEGLPPPTIGLKCK